MSKTYDELHYILVIMDGISQYLEITPLKGITSDSVINGMKRHWIGRHGTPQKFLTDQGSQMDGIDIRDMCLEFGIDKEHSSPHHPQGDGLSERTIGLAKQLFKSTLLIKHLGTKDWTTIISYVMIAWNTKKHSSTGFTPYELLCGSRMAFHPHEDRLQKSDSSGKTNNSALLERLCRNRGNLVEKVQIYLNKNREKMKKQYDKKVFNSDISLGNIAFYVNIMCGEVKRRNSILFMKKCGK